MSAAARETEIPGNNVSTSETASASDIQRFNRKWTPEPNTGCWLWTAGVDKDGYGKFQTGPNGHQTNWRAHRFVLEVITGVVGEVAEHTCNQPACVNPAHLRWGTHQTNIAARHAQQRDSRGERHPRARLTEEAVRAIRESSASLSKLAAEFGAAKATIRDVRRGSSWRHVG